MRLNIPDLEYLNTFTHCNFFCKSTITFNYSQFNNGMNSELHPIRKHMQNTVYKIVTNSKINKKKDLWVYKNNLRSMVYCTYSIGKYLALVKFCFIYSTEYITFE